MRGTRGTTPREYVRRLGPGWPEWFEFITRFVVHDQDHHHPWANIMPVMVHTAQLKNVKNDCFALLACTVDCFGYAETEIEIKGEYDINIIHDNFMSLSFWNIHISANLVENDDKRDIKILIILIWFLAISWCGFDICRTTMIIDNFRLIVW